MKQPSIEVLSFEGCPNRDEAVRLVRRVADELALEPRIQLIDVPDPEAAIRERFLGSPTIRVDGRDVEPGAEERRDFVFACRVYRGERGLVGQPDEDWVREALAQKRK